MRLSSTLWILIASVAMWAGLADAATAQSLVERYRAARFRVQADEIVAGFRAKPQPTAHVDFPTDTLRDWVVQIFPAEEVIPPPPPEPAISIRRSNLVPKLGRSWFQSKFDSVKWAFVGSNSWTSLDTTFTRDLRARLEAEFGSPTQTIADHDYVDRGQPKEYIQFEYWFVVNDTIPLKVMDVNGPFERGLVVATAREYHDVLPDLKEIFLGPLTESDRAPYVDYYYLPEQRMWFLTGYDGEKYFLERIPRPDLKLGRPLLELRND